MLALTALRRRLLTGLLPLVLVLCALPAGAQAGIANAGLPGAGSDPLSGLRWGNYSGSQDEVFPAYRAANGENRRLLGLIALRPRARWFGAWYADNQVESTVRAYLANATGGDPNVLAQAAVFRLVPWEGAACRSLPTAAQQASYKAWIQAFAAGVGSTRLALILQPDLPFAGCVPHHSPIPLSLVAYATQVFSALPHTSVYIDAGAGDWPTVANDAAWLRAADVAGARGFALDATHYDSTANEIRFGQKLVRSLAAAHIPNRHFVINTAENGEAFTYQQYRGGNYDNAAVCASRSARRCVTLGIPPTWDVASSRWGLSARVRAVAAQLVDGYLWFGRPWLDNQSDPFDLSRALALARTTPF